MSMLPLFAMANIISQWITDQFMPSPTGFNGINHYKAEHERLKRGLSPLSNVYGGGASTFQDFKTLLVKQ